VLFFLTLFGVYQRVGEFRPHVSKFDPGWAALTFPATAFSNTQILAYFALSEAGGGEGGETLLGQVARGYVTVFGSLVLVVVLGINARFWLFGLAGLAKATPALPLPVLPDPPSPPILLIVPSSPPSLPGVLAPMAACSRQNQGVEVPASDTRRGKGA
jgi:hypothetical protein